MLTYNKKSPVTQKDRPWLLVVLSLIWVLGTAFFHSPWEPFEPFVLAVVKGILYNHSWFVPYISNAPYLEIQPFYFWFYCAIIKLLGISSITGIANSVRIINTLIIFATISVCARIGSKLDAYKNGRTVTLLLISTIGFINNAYQLSPHILIILGFALFLYALQLHRGLPGISGWVLFIGLLFISISFTCEFALIAFLTLLLLPLIDKYWRHSSYLLTVSIGVILFAIIFWLYCYGLQEVNKEFFWQWKVKYTNLYDWRHNTFLNQFIEVFKLLIWYIAPTWLIMAWSLYKRGKLILKEKLAHPCLILVILMTLYGLSSGLDAENALFPIIIPVVLLASLEVDSIRITIVSLFNWFSICLCGIIGLLFWICYFALNFKLSLLQVFTAPLLAFTQNFNYRFELWRFLLAILVTVVWVFMITRRHIRGREMVTNWASGTTFVLALFMSLLLPWFDSILTFKPIVRESLQYINKKQCVATDEANTTHGALWYYYVNVNLMPSFVLLDYSLCSQAVVATESPDKINTKVWNIVWQAKRPIDKKIYYVLRHKGSHK